MTTTMNQNAREIARLAPPSRMYYARMLERFWRLFQFPRYLAISLKIVPGDHGLYSLVRILWLSGWGWSTRKTHLTIQVPWQFFRLACHISYLRRLFFPFALHAGEAGEFHNFGESNTTLKCDWGLNATITQVSLIKISPFTMWLTLDN